MDIECRTTDETSTRGWVGYSLADPKQFGSCCGRRLQSFVYNKQVLVNLITVSEGAFPNSGYLVFTHHTRALTHSAHISPLSRESSKVFGSSDTRDGRMMESPRAYLSLNLQHENLLYMALHPVRTPLMKAPPQTDTVARIPNAVLAVH